MAMRCSVCSHKDLDAINTALISGTSTLEIAGRYGLSKSAVHNHLQQHARPLAARYQMQRGKAIVSYLDGLKAKLEGLIAKCESDLDADRAKLLPPFLRELRMTVETIAKATGELQDESEVSKILTLFGLRAVADLERLAEERRSLAEASDEDLLEATTEALADLLTRRPALASDVLERVPQLGRVVA